MEPIDFCPHCHRAITEAGKQALETEARSMANARKVYDTSYREDPLFVLSDPSMILSPFITYAVTTVVIFLLTNDYEITYTGVKWVYPVISMLISMSVFLVLMKIRVKRQKKRDAKFWEDHPKEAAILWPSSS